MAAHDAAVLIAGLGGAQAVADLHDTTLVARLVQGYGDGERASSVKGMEESSWTPDVLAPSRNVPSVQD